MNEASKLDDALNATDVEAVFQALLRRPVGDDDYTQRLAASGYTLRQLMVDIRACRELREKVGAEIEAGAISEKWDPTHFRAPIDLQLSARPLGPVLIVGSCLMDWWASQLAGMSPPVDYDLYLPVGELPEAPRRPAGEYAFQLVQLPLRSVLPDGQFARLHQADLAGHEKLFAHGAEMVRQLLHAAMRWNRAHGLLTFVFPLLTPQQNPIGRLLPRFELSNPVYFIERLNQVLTDELRAYRNCHLFDLTKCCPRLAAVSCRRTR